MSLVLSQWRAALAIEQKAAEPLLATAVALYTQGNQEEGLAKAESALQLDDRYGDLAFLKENLWGEHLLKDTRTLLQTPRIQATLAKLQEQPKTPQLQN